MGTVKTSEIRMRLVLCTVYVFITIICKNFLHRGRDVHRSGVNNRCVRDSLSRRKKIDETDDEERLLKHHQRLRELTLRVNVTETHRGLHGEREVHGIDEGRARTESLEVLTTGASHKEVEKGESEDNNKVPLQAPPDGRHVYLYAIFFSQVINSFLK